MVDVLRSSIVLKRRAKAPAPAWCEVYSTHTAWRRRQQQHQSPFVSCVFTFKSRKVWQLEKQLQSVNMQWQSLLFCLQYYYCCYSLQEISCTVLLLQNIYTVITTITNSDNCKTTIVYILSVTRVCFVSAMKWLFMGNCRKNQLLINTTSY